MKQQIISEKKGEITINVPVKVNYYREEDRIAATAFSTLIEAELLKPEFHTRLTDLIFDVKVAALKTLNETFPPTK